MMTNREKARISEARYRERNREKRRASGRKRYQKMNEENKKLYNEKTVEWRKQNPEKYAKIQKKYHDNNNVKLKKRNSRLKRNFKITLKDYEKMLEEQNGVCKICKNPETTKTLKNLSVDHCHNTGKVRGLLCRSCNVALGLFKDDIEIITNSIKYLKGDFNVKK
jgi:hypothetical protein